MLRIFYVIENLYFGGGERAFAQIINSLDKNKYKIYVACLSGGLFAEKIKNSATILPISLRNRFTPLVIWKLARMMKEKDIQVVHSQGARADFFARIAGKIAKVPAVVSTNPMPVERFNVGWLRRVIYNILDRFSERFVYRFIVVSEALKHRLIEKHKISPQRIVRIYNGIEIKEYNADLKNISNIRDEFNISPDACLVGAIGRLVLEKGLTYFMQAIRDIVRGDLHIANKIKFLIVGEGYARRELEYLVRRLDIKEKVIFTGFRKDIKAILQELDILVLSSILEGHPIILLEAMAMAKPVVATNIEGMNEIVIDGLTGMLVPPKDSHALAEAVVCLLKDNKKAQEMAQAARKMVEEKFDIKDKINQYKQLYETIAVEKLGVC